jgi:signal transduction histidine kinase
MPLNLDNLFRQHAAWWPVRLRLSLRWRITLLTVLVFACIQSVLTVGLLFYVEHGRERQLRATLEQQALSLANVLASTSVMPSNEAFGSLVESEPRSILVEELLVSLYSSDGKLLATNCKPAVSFSLAGGAEAAEAKAAVHRQFEVRALQSPDGQQRSGRTVATPFIDPTGRPLVLVSATSDAFIQQLTGELRRLLLWAMPVGLVAALVSGWFIAGLAVRPLKRLQQIAQLLTPSSLGARIDFGSTATEVARLQERLNEARRRLETGYRVQEQFAGNVAHELKTPLAIIVAQADLVRTDSTLPAHARQFIETTREESMRLARLCESFLLLTRVRHGKPVHTTARPCPVNELVMSCVEGARGTASRFRVELQPTLLDDANMDATVTGDHDLLETMLDNLIRNACRFSPAGGAVEIGATVEAHQVRLSVRDFGPGVPRQMMSRIFERFEQAQPDGSRWGSGIGLQIARGIAELHGGTIAVENRPDIGCVFTVTLPLARPADAVPDTATDAAPVGAASEPAPSPQVSPALASAHYSVA